MMREVQRRALLTHVRDQGEHQIAHIVQPFLTRRYKQITRELRRAKFNKRLRPGPKLADLYKQDAELDQEWQTWIEEFDRALTDAMMPVIVDAYDVETKFWLTRQLRPDPVNAAKILDNYLNREGRQIKNIAENTRDDTLAMITDWYNTDAGLPELIDQLGQFYNDYRAETIGRTESTFITSSVSLDMMNQFDVQAWTWDLADEDGEWPCEECKAMAQAGPYQPGDEMPPLHPRCRCGMVYANADGSELIYKGQHLTFVRPIIVRPFLVKEFNPDQPRDEHGRFAPGGGGAEAATAAAPQGRQFQMSPAAGAPKEVVERPAQAPGGQIAEEPTQAAPVDAPKSGGSYRTMKANAQPGEEVHHMPAEQASPLKQENGPAIRMSATDHLLTASYGNTQAAKDYRAAQAALIHQGKFQEAQLMDIEDIRAKFGGKYDGQIRQMMDYTARLKTGKHGYPLNPTPKQIRGGKF